MADEKLAQNAECAEPGHDEHLCFLMYNGFHHKNRDQYRAMVKDARYWCLRCNRTAKNAENLCEPQDL